MIFNRNHIGKHQTGGTKRFAQELTAAALLQEEPLSSQQVAEIAAKLNVKVPASLVNTTFPPVPPADADPTLLNSFGTKAVVTPPAAATADQQEPPLNPGADQGGAAPSSTPSTECNCNVCVAKRKAAKRLARSKSKAAKSKEKATAAVAGAGATAGDAGAARPAVGSDDTDDGSSTTAPNGDGGDGGGGVGVRVGASGGGSSASEAIYDAETDNESCDSDDGPPLLHPCSMCFEREEFAFVGQGAPTQCFHCAKLFCGGCVPNVSRASHECNECRRSLGPNRAFDKMKLKRLIASQTTRWHRRAAKSGHLQQQQREEAKKPDIDELLRDLGIDDSVMDVALYKQEFRGGAAAAAAGDDDQGGGGGGGGSSVGRSSPGEGGGGPGRCSPTQGGGGGGGGGGGAGSSNEKKIPKGRKLV
eukprot:gene5559-19007_t